MLVMIVPVSLLLGQLALWYQVRPLRVGEEAVVTVQFAGAADAALPEVKLEADLCRRHCDLGPVRIFSQREICVGLRARENGCHRLGLSRRRADGGEGVGRRRRLHAHQRGAAGLVLSTSCCSRPSRPSAPISPVRSIRIAYPDRDSWTAAPTGGWPTAFAASMFFAFCFRPLLKVNL